MESIRTLEQLHHNLIMGPGYEGYAQLIKAIELPPKAYAPLCRWSETRYQRIRFYDTQSLEGLITCWKPGQYSSIHNYEDSVGWLKVLEGQIDWEHFSPQQYGAKPTYHKTFNPGEIGFLNDELGFHRFVNRGEAPTVMLVFYADKIERWQEFDPATLQISEKQVTVDLNLDPDQASSG